MLHALLAGWLLATAFGAAAHWEWWLPPGFPEPAVAPENPMSAVKVELGRHLFYDRRLSVNGNSACATCHRQELAFTDGHAQAHGTTGELHPRGAMSLANVAYSPLLGWDDPGLASLEAQARVPLFNQHPIELGLAGHEVTLLVRLSEDARYRELFAASFPGAAEPITIENLIHALAAFERTLISGDAPFDRWLKNDQPIAPAARRGMKLFYSERLRCALCHRGFTFSSGKDFHNTGLYDVDGRGAYPAGGEGLYRHTRKPEDMGKFRAPTLRNVAVTAPYMHDGSVATLAEAIELYARGGRTRSPLKDPLLEGFAISPEEKNDLIAFLESLTDRGFLSDPRHGAPFASPRATP